MSLPFNNSAHGKHLDCLIAASPCGVSTGLPSPSYLLRSLEEYNPQLGVGGQDHSIVAVSHTPTYHCCWLGIRHAGKGNVRGSDLCHIKRYGAEVQQCVALAVGGKEADV